MSFFLPKICVSGRKFETNGISPSFTESEEESSLLKDVAMEKSLPGRIIVYSIVGCPHCIAAKSKLKELGLPFTEISVDKYPREVRDWLKNRTKKTSVPQIFFNGIHVGGNSELQEATRNEERWKELVSEVENNPFPQGSDELYIPPLNNTSKSEGQEFSCEPDEYFSIVEALLKSDIVKSHKKGGIFSETVKDSFNGKDFLNWLHEEKNFSRDRGTKTGQELILRKFVFAIDSDGNFKDDDKALYRLQTGNDPQCPLNSSEGELSVCVQRPADEIGEDIRRIILDIYAKYLSSDGLEVDYEGMRSSGMFANFRSMTRQLQRTDVRSLSRQQKLAFFINIYNALVIHGNVERGIPTNLWKRYKFFSSIGYNIGGHFYSLNDIENGVLRANRSSMATLFRIPFGSKNDPRLQVSLEKVEPRIHFALNCGAKSCPPIKTFSSAEVDEELKTATEAFLETEEALIVSKSGEIHLSMIFKWYQIDFGQNKKELLEWIAENSSNVDLKDLIKTGNYKIRYIPYNWGNNSKK